LQRCDAAASLQLCAGQPGGFKTAVQAANEIFQYVETD